MSVYLKVENTLNFSKSKYLNGWISVWKRWNLIHLRKMIRQIAGKNRFTPRFNNRTCLETVKIDWTWIMMWMNTTSFYYFFWIKFFILDLDNKIWIWSVVWKKKKNLLKFNLTILNIGSSNKIELHSINSV